MARIEDERNGIGAFRRYFCREVADLFTHLVLREIGCIHHFEPGIAEQLGHRPGVVCRIGKRNHGTVIGLADDERNTTLGKCRVRAQ